MLICWNMKQIWEEHFAFVQAKTGVPLVIGEMGGFYTDKDKVWQDWAFGLMKERGIGAGRLEVPGLAQVLRRLQLPHSADAARHSARCTAAAAGATVASLGGAPGPRPRTQRPAR